MESTERPNEAELSIGNYVLHHLDNKIIQLDFIESDDFCFNDPIPLTEEWLLKFGAVCQPWGWVLHEILIKWSKDKYWIELGNGKTIELPYVHNLQNLFTLTGNELTIK